MSFDDYYISDWVQSIVFKYVLENNGQKAQMAELVDALGSGPNARKGVEVRVFFWAPVFWYILSPFLTPFYFGYLLWQQSRVSFFNFTLWLAKLRFRQPETFVKPIYPYNKYKCYRVGILAHQPPDRAEFS